MKAYRNCLDFYHGIQWEGHPLRSEKRLTFNYSKVFIDKVSSYLISGINFCIDPLTGSPEDKEKSRQAEAALMRVHADNRLTELDMETEVDCAILGDAVYKVIWDPGSRKVRVTAPDVQGIYAWWSGDDISRVWKIASRYQLTSEEIEMLYNVKPASKTASLIEVWTEKEFELYLDNALLDKKVNPYGFIPFILYPNLREPKHFWGISDLAQIKETQRELNREMSQLSRILELSGNPVAVLENIEASEDIAVKPGAVWNIPEDAKAYLLDLLQGGGVQLHIDYINLLYRVLHDISESPRAAFGSTDKDMSGVAMQLELQPLQQKVERKRLIRTSAFVRRSWMILRMLEMFDGADFGNYQPRVAWAPVLPQDIERRVASEQTLVQTGIHSRRRAMDELGISNPDLEFRLWLEEREAILKMNRDTNNKNKTE